MKIFTNANSMNIYAAPCTSAPPLCGSDQERVMELVVILLTRMVGATGGLTMVTL